MSGYQTQGSVAKMAVMLARILEQKGYDSDAAHSFTVLPTDVTCADTRIVLVVEPLKAPERTPDAKL